MSYKIENQEYYGGKMKPLVQVTASLVKRNPDLADDHPKLHATLAVNLDGYGKRDKCYNCGRSMEIKLYTADLLDALLILAMARVVRENVRGGKAFTEANAVYLPSLPVTNGVLKRSTKCGYLGLIKQPPYLRNTGKWVLTQYAFKALRGEKIPKSVKYWEGIFLGRSTETTTLGEMFRTHVDLVERAIARRGMAKSDYRNHIGDYSPSEWVEFGGYIQYQRREGS